MQKYLYFHILCSSISYHDTQEPVPYSMAVSKARHGGVKGGQGAGTAGDNYLQSKDTAEKQQEQQGEVFCLAGLQEASGQRQLGLNTSKGILHCLIFF